MVSLEKISGLSEPANPAPFSTRLKKAQGTHPAATERTQISADGRAVAEAARLLEESEAAAARHAEQVARVREAVERGTYQIQQVVFQVAARVTKYLKPET
jgi:anti-sigma28 factor (negative regulator of flagellin synthesis)